MPSIGFLFSKKYWWLTLIVIAGMVFLAGLGKWQLDRLEWRRGENAKTAAELAQGVFDLNAAISAEPQGDSSHLLPKLNRAATVTGTFDESETRILLFQNIDAQRGSDIIAPLLIDGSDKAILVNRGWIPDTEVANIANYVEEGTVTINGRFQPTQPFPSTGNRSLILDEVDIHRIDIETMNEQTPYELLPVYLLQSPDPDATSDDLPVRIEPVFTLDEGSHLSYAIQWFSFSLMLGGGYLYLMRRRENVAKS